MAKRVSRDLDENFRPYGIGWWEYSILGRLRERSRPESIAIVDVYDLAPGVGHYEALREAMKKCFEKKLVGIVTAEEELEQRSRMKREKFPRCYELDYSRQGHADLTGKGYKLLNKISLVSNSFPDIGTRIPRRNSKFREVYAKSRSRLMAYLANEIESEYDDFEILEIFPVAKWRLSRFELVESGFCAKVTQRRHVTEAE